MKKLILLLLFIPLISFGQDITINSNSYISGKISISQAISYTNVNEIYDQVGIHYLGNGYYLLCVMENSRYSAQYKFMDNIRMLLDQYKSGTVYEGVNPLNETERRVGRKWLIKRIIRLTQTEAFCSEENPCGYQVTSNDFPMLTRDDAVSRLKDNKELLELGLMTQKKYDRELVGIKRSISDLK